MGHLGGLESQNYIFILNQINHAPTFIKLPWEAENLLEIATCIFKSVFGISGHNLMVWRVVNKKITYPENLNKNVKKLVFDRKSVGFSGTFVKSSPERNDLCEL